MLIAARIKHPYRREGRIGPWMSVPAPFPARPTEWKVRAMQRCREQVWKRGISIMYLEVRGRRIQGLFFRGELQARSIKQEPEGDVPVMEIF